MRTLKQIKQQDGVNSLKAIHIQAGEAKSELSATHCSAARLETPRTDAREQRDDDGGYRFVSATFARELERELNQSRHENSVLCAFINREMKMTGSDPRISELEKRIAAQPNELDQAQRG